MFSPELLFTGLTHETRTVWAGPPRGFPAFARRKDRSKFSAMCDELGVDQPEWSEFVKLEVRAPRSRSGRARFVGSFVRSCVLLLFLSIFAFLGLFARERHDV